MPIEFTQFPNSWRLPLFWAEIDPSQAGLSEQQLPALLVGQMYTASFNGNPAGLAVPNVPVPIGRIEDAATQFGIGSMLWDMVNIFYQNNTAQELWCLPVADPTGSYATGNVTVATAPTAPGVLSLYVAGQLVNVNIGATDTTAVVAANIVLAVNAMDTLPASAALQSSGSSVVVFTANHKGNLGDDIDVRDTYYARLGGQILPPGLTLTYPTNNKLSGGVGAPDFTAAIANLGDNLYEYVGLPYTDESSLFAWQTEYAFTSAGRWGWMRQLYGQIYSARRDSYANLIVWGETQNAGQTSVMAVEVDAPSPIWEWTSAYDAEAAMGFSNDPARPLQTLQLLGILPATKANRFVLTEQNLLASTGLAPQYTDAAGNVRIFREVSTYQLNPYGSPDNAYSDMTTLATLSKLLRDMKASITSKYPRSKLADDGTLFGPGQVVVTPKIAKAELVAEYALEEFNGLVEDSDLFAQNLIVERDSVNPDRLNVLYPPNLIGQLRIFAVLAQFRLLGAEQTTVPQS